MLQALLRSRLYRTRVAIEVEGGLRHEGRVAEIRHDGSRSAVILAPRGRRPSGGLPPVELPLSRIRAVRPVRDSVARPGEAT